MALIRFLAIFFLIYLVFKLIKQLFTGATGKKRSSEPDVTTDQTQQKRKIISKDEGEYVDFEEISKKQDKP